MSPSWEFGEKSLKDSGKISNLTILDVNWGEKTFFIFYQKLLQKYELKRYLTFYIRKRNYTITINIINRMTASRKTTTMI